MKAKNLSYKDLMVGDWVSYHGIVNKVAPADFDFHNKKWINEIEPIPLTVEILEKNGLECKHKGESLKRLYWILNVEGSSVKVKVNRGLFLFDIHGVPFQHGFYLPSVNKHIQYVHDLQHAFRLCGIAREIIL